MNINLHFLDISKPNPDHDVVSMSVCRKSSLVESDVYAGVYKEYFKKMQKK